LAILTWLEVSVDDTVRMEVVKGARDLGHVKTHVLLLIPKDDLRVKNEGGRVCCCVCAVTHLESLQPFEVIEYFAPGTIFGDEVKLFSGLKLKEKGQAGRARTLESRARH
jgi:hypothetical protein